MRVPIWLSPGAEPLDVLQRLYALTALETTFRVDMATQAGATRVQLNLRSLIDRFLEGRDPDVVRRELPELARRHGDERRTTIVADDDV